MKNQILTAFLAITFLSTAINCTQNNTSQTLETSLAANWYNSSKQLVVTSCTKASVLTKEFGSAIKQRTFDKMSDGYTKKAFAILGSSAQYGLEAVWNNKTVSLIALTYIWLTRQFESYNPIRWYRNYKKNIVKKGLLKHDAKQATPLGTITEQELEKATDYYLNNPGVLFADIYDTIPAIKERNSAAETEFLQNKNTYINTIITSYESKVTELLDSELNETQKIKAQKEKKNFIEKINKHADMATKSVDSRNNFLSIYQSSQKTLEELKKEDKSTTTTALQQSNLFKMWVENSVDAIKKVSSTDV